MFSAATCQPTAAVRVAGGGPGLGPRARPEGACEDECRRRRDEPSRQVGDRRRRRRAAPGVLTQRRRDDAAPSIGRRSRRPGPPGTGHRRGHGIMPPSHRWSDVLPALLVGPGNRRATRTRQAMSAPVPPRHMGFKFECEGGTEGPRTLGLGS